MSKCIFRDSLIVASVSGPRCYLSPWSPLSSDAWFLKCEVWERRVWDGFYYFNPALFYTITLIHNVQAMTI